MNDDLSASYGKYTSRKAGYANSNQSVGEGDRVAEVTSWQIAYTKFNNWLLDVMKQSDNKKTFII